MFSKDKMESDWLQLAAHGGSNGAVTVHQDLSLYGTRLPEGGRVTYSFRPGRYGWLQVADGSVLLGDTPLRAGDGAAISDERSIILTGTSGTPAEVLLFDLA
jgi:redox-sensitive bicupin YhaK (pirin superfamily)